MLVRTYRLVQKVHGESLLAETADVSTVVQRTPGSRIRSALSLQRQDSIDELRGSMELKLSADPVAVQVVRVGEGNQRRIIEGVQVPEPGHRRRQKARHPRRGGRNLFRRVTRDRAVLQLGNPEFAERVKAQTVVLPEPEERKEGMSLSVTHVTLLTGRGHEYRSQPIGHAERSTELLVAYEVLTHLRRRHAHHGPSQALIVVGTIRRQHAARGKRSSGSENEGSESQHSAQFRSD